VESLTYTAFAKPQSGYLFGFFTTPSSRWVKFSSYLLCAAGEGAIQLLSYPSWDLAQAPGKS